MQETCLEPSTEHRPLMVRIGAFFFAWRNWVFTAWLLAILAGFRPAPLLGDWRADLWLDVAGFAITAFGQVVRMLVIGYAPIRSGGSRKKVDAEALLTSGLLSHVRNPLYVGNILIMVGMAVIHNNPWVYVLALPPTLFAYSAIVANEEAFLTRTFGEDYREFCRRVPRWLPNLRGLRQTLRNGDFDGRRVLLQEYGSVWIALAFPVGLMLHERWGLPGQEGWTRTMAALLIVITLGWAWCRRIKLIEVARRKALQESGTSS